MSASTVDWKDELRLSPTPVMVGLVALCVVAWYLGEPLDAWPRIELLLLAVLFGSLVAWLLYRWKPLVGNCVLLVGLSGLVWVLRAWLGWSGFLPVLAVLTALSAALIGTTGSAAMAAGTSMLLLIGWRLGVTMVGPEELASTLVAMWVMVGIMVAVYQPMRQFYEQVMVYHQQSQGLVERARDRQAELHQAFEDLAQANRQLTLFNEKWAGLRAMAEEAERAKTAFLSRVSHEFRTPLNMIIGIAELMVEAPETLDAEIPPTIRRHLQTLHRNAEHLARMVNDVLDLSQIQAGKLALHREQADLAGIVKEAIEVVSPLITQKGLQLAVDIPEELPPVYCDPTRILQVILNLASNAARYTEQGRVIVRVAAGDGEVTVSVADTGPGIPPRDAERIFEPFSQGTSPAALRKGGSGLGLSISKQFVEMHDGRLWLESRVGEGSTFAFTLPLSPLAGPIAGPGRWNRRGGGWAPLTAEPACRAPQAARGHLRPDGPPGSALCPLRR
jgi:signal transduction histidine kinase